MKNPVQLLAAGLSGIVATVIDVAVLLLLVGLHVPVPLATFVAALSGAGTNFIANKYVAFRDRSPLNLGQVARFYLVAVVTAALLALLCMPDSDVPAVFAMSALLLVLASGHDGISHLMASRVVFFMGEISYSLYLLHSQFLRVRRIGEVRWLVSTIGAVGADIVALIVLYASLVLCSWLTYRLVESPCRAWFRQVGSSVRPVSPTVRIAS